MLPMLRKHTIITAALLATLTLSACGKKKDVIATPPQTPQTQTPEGQATPAPAKPGTGTGSTDGSMGGGLPDPNGGGDQTYNPPPPDETEPTPLPDAEPTPRPGTPPPVVDNKPTPSTPEQIPDNYVPNDANNVTRGDYNKRFTGGVAADGLFYTSSSTDELLNFLRARNERVGAETRRLNERAAASVSFAKMSVDGLSGDVLVTLQVNENGGTAVYKLAGAAQEGAASPLRLVKSGTTGTRALEGTWKCVDLDGGCENVFVRLKIGSTPTSAIINVVFRYTDTDLWFSLPGNRSENPEYAVLRNMMINTIQRNSASKNRLSSATMSSWEVVNGRSGVTLTMKTYTNELLAFAGPLLAPEAGTGVNIRLARLASDKTDSMDLMTNNQVQLNYANTIEDARMIANNGLGQVRIALKMRKRLKFTQDQFAVTFMRKIKPIVELTDDNLK